MKTIFKNKKIKIYSFGVVIISVLLAGVFMQSCSNEDEISNSLSEEKMNEIAAPYLIFQSNQFILDLSKQKAVKLGITEFYYKKILKDIQQANEDIEKNNLVEEVRFSFENLDKSEIRHIIPRLKDGNEYSNNNFWSINDVSSSKSFYVTNGTIQFTGNTACLVGVISITVTMGSQSINASMTLLPFGNNVRMVTLPYMSGYCYVTCYTACSGGGSVVVNW
jgi:hypothetical protein